VSQSSNTQFAFPASQADGLALFLSGNDSRRRESFFNTQMKTIIDGKRYDTDTAAEIDSWSNRCSYGDFNSCSETLYKTKSGAFFLHGKGGALSKYAESLAGGRFRCDGAKIVPMSRTDAMAWCEEHDKVDAIELEFAEEIQNA